MPQYMESTAAQVSASDPRHCSSTGSIPSRSSYLLFVCYLCISGEALINADIVWLLNYLPADVRAMLSPGVVINQVCMPLNAREA